MNESNLKINRTGQILKGEYKGWYVHIEHDDKKDQGYLILIFESLDPQKGLGYDYWAEDKSSLIQIMNESEWEIKWLDEDGEVFQNN